MNTSDDEFEKEYALRTLSKGARGRYFGEYQKGINVVVIGPELSKTFPNAKAINEALRKVLKNEKKAAS